MKKEKHFGLPLPNTMYAADYSTRWTSQRGSRPVRIANCSGYKGTLVTFACFQC